VVSHDSLLLTVTQSFIFYLLIYLLTYWLFAVSSTDVIPSRRQLLYIMVFVVVGCYGATLRAKHA